MPAAVRAHRRHRQAWYADLIGPFVLAVVGAGRDFADVLRGEPLEVSLTVRKSAVAAPLARAAAVDGVQVAALEVIPSGEVAELVAMLDAELPPGVLGYIEVPRGAGTVPALDAIAGTRYRAKFRTGGTEPASHPGEAELAAALLAAVERGVAFKCTAGLHHAVRHTDGELEQHGFLNVLLATASAQAGAGAPDLAAILAERSGETVAGQLTGLQADAIARAREAFVSFGTCSIDDPVADLVKLELINVDVA